MLQRPHFLFRAFHSTSGSKYINGGFVCTATHGVRHNYKASDLINHFNSANREPTNWISTTSCVLRALKIAIDASTNGKEGVSIAVISFDRCVNVPCAARIYGRLLGVEIAPWQETEYLVELEIPAMPILACLPLQTLIDRGLFTLVPQLDPCSKYYNTPGDFRGTSVSRLLATITGARDMWSVDNRLWEMGTRAAKVAECFGHSEHTLIVAIQVAEWWDGVPADREMTAESELIGKALQERREGWVDYCKAYFEELAALEVAEEKRALCIEQGDARKGKKVYQRLAKKAKIRRNRQTGCFPV